MLRTAVLALSRLPPGDRGKFSLRGWRWRVVVACYLRLALGFLCAQPGARGAEGEHHDCSFETLTAWGVV